VTADEVSVNLGDATPRHLLVNWANGQDAWVRQLTAETILSRKAPSEDLLDDVYRTFLGEKGLGDAAVEVPALELSTTQSSEEEILELVSLTAVAGVNALATDQQLYLDPDLTILFGQNGSGKTGYARILKRISAVRTAEDILPNAHVVQLDSPPTPSAQIAYRLSGNDFSVHWSNEAGLAPFTRISVFDAGAVSLHVDSDLGYVYTPAELALFAHVAAGIQGVQQRIAAEVSSLSPGSNPLLSKFTRGTRVYPLIETLGSTTDPAELDAIATLLEDAEADRERLESEVAALRSNTLDALVSNAQETERRLARLHALLTSVTTFNEDTYEAARVGLETAERRRVEAREQLFSSDELPGPPDEAWQEFVVASDSYRRHISREHYPRNGDACLYCVQELSPAALDLLTRYRTYLDETLVQQVTDARTAVGKAGLILDVTELTRSSEFATGQRDRESPPAWAAAAVEALSAARTTAHETNQAKAVSQSGTAVAEEPPRHRRHHRCRVGRTQSTPGTSTTAPAGRRIRPWRSDDAAFASERRPRRAVAQGRHSGQVPVNDLVPLRITLRSADRPRRGPAKLLRPGERRLVIKPPTETLTRKRSTRCRIIGIFLRCCPCSTNPSHEEAVKCGATTMLSSQVSDRPTKWSGSEFR
jgi:hypothetical protein